MNSSGISNNKYRNYIYIAFGVLFIAGLISLIWKCRYGFPYEESYHISTALRFWRGDRMLLHEWHGTQLSFLLLTPVAGLFEKFNGGTEGIVLFCRYVFVVFWAVFALFIFLRLKSLSRTGAVLASLMIMFYVPSEEMSLYYNTLGIAFLLSASVIIVTAKKFVKVQYVIAGILYSMAVLCCPFLAVAYLVFTVVIVVCLIKKNRSNLEIWLFTTAGVAASALVFVILCLTAGSFDQYLKMVPMMFKDNEHQIDLIDKVTGYIAEISLSSFVTMLAVILAVLLIFAVKHKILIKDKESGLTIVFTLAELIFIFYLIQGRSIANYYMFPLAITAPYLRFVYEDEVNKLLFRYVWIPGIIYSLCIHMSSNLGFMSIASACTVSSAAAAVMGIRCFRSHVASGNKIIFKTAAVTMAAAFAFQFAMLGERRLNFVFADNDISLEKVYVDHGIAKGLTISEESYATYEFQRSEITPLLDDSVRRILVITNEYWLYLDTGKEVGAYTSLAWVYEPQDLFMYYEMFPDKKPDAIYIDNMYKDISSVFEHLGYTKNETSGGGFILFPTA